MSYYFRVGALLSGGPLHSGGVLLSDRPLFSGGGVSSWWAITFGWGRFFLVGHYFRVGALLSGSLKIK